MKNRNGHLSTPTLWFWAEDNTAIDQPAGVLVVTAADWDEFTNEAKARYRPVRRRDGLTGKGTVTGKLLLVKLD